MVQNKEHSVKVQKHDEVRKEDVSVGTRGYPMVNTSRHMNPEKDAGYRGRQPSTDSHQNSNAAAASDGIASLQGSTLLPGKASLRLEIFAYIYIYITSFVQD